MFDHWRSWLLDDRSATAVEYAVLIGLIITVLYSTIAALGGSTGGLWNNNREALEAHGM